MDTDRHTDRHTDRTSSVTLAHARRGLINTGCELRIIHSKKLMLVACKLGICAG